MAKTLSDPMRMFVGLQAAAYMRWVETRKGASPSSHDTQRFIQGLLDNDRFSYESNDLQMIELLALATDLDLVHAFIRDNDFFVKLDRAAQPRKPIP
jgi:hypothetical protein